MEYLSWLMKILQAIPDFNYHPHREKLRTAHLSFVNDLFSYDRGDYGSVELLMKVFMNFSNSSCLVANVSKSGVFFLGEWIRICVLKYLQLFSLRRDIILFHYMGVTPPKNYILCSTSRNWAIYCKGFVIGL